MIGLDKFKRELRGLMPGDRKNYYRGSIAIGRDSNFVLDQIATLLYQLQELGFVILYQKRDDEGVMCYWYMIKERITKERIDEAERLKLA